MKPASRNVEGSRGWLSRLVAGWDHFWFSPADPTLLGLIRICCGLVVLYVHFAYSYDLETICGKHAWIDLQLMNEFRHESPVISPSLAWNDGPEVAIPRTAEEANYAEAYRAKWGENPPPPFPRSDEQAQRYDDYRARWGIDERLAWSKGRALWSVWFHVTDPTWMWVVHACILVVMALFTLGFCTRITSVLTFLGMLCYIQRAPTTLFGMDTIMIVVVLYLMIGPSGAALSIDRLIARYWATKRALERHQPPPDFLQPQPQVSANLALRLMQVHICIIYLAAGLSKLQGELWWNGTAIWGTMANYEFSPVRYPLYVRALTWLAEHRLLWELTMTGSALFTLAFEIGFPFLVWVRQLRWTMVAAALMMHGGIAFFMGLTTFSMMMLTLVLAFVPAGAVTQLLWRLGRGRAGARWAVAGV